MSNIERRRLLAAVAAAGAAIPLVAACGGDDSNPNSGNTTEASATPETTESEEPSPSETASPSEEPQGGNAIAKTSDIPVGGGKIFDTEELVITQPTAGEFKGFTNICTHRGCPVRTVEGGTINCTCHGSKFKITDGSVSTGPATQPLAAKNIAVNGDSITLA